MFQYFSRFARSFQYQTQGFISCHPILTNDLHVPPLTRSPPRDLNFSSTIGHTLTKIVQDFREIVVAAYLANETELHMVDHRVSPILTCHSFNGLLGSMVKDPEYS